MHEGALPRLREAWPGCFVLDQVALVHQFPPALVHQFPPALISPGAMETASSPATASAEMERIAGEKQRAGKVALEIDEENKKRSLACSSETVKKMLGASPRFFRRRSTPLFLFTVSSTPPLYFLSLVCFKLPSVSSRRSLLISRVFFCLVP